MKEQFYYFDDNDYCACGAYDTYEDAKIDAEAHADPKRAYTIVKVAAVSPPPSTKRRWK